MRGGEEMGQLTLSRLFTLHAAVLPAAILGVIALHLIAFRRFGSVGPWVESERQRKGIFWPDQVHKDALTGITVILALLALCAFAPKAWQTLIRSCRTTARRTVRKTGESPSC